MTVYELTYHAEMRIKERVGIKKTKHHTMMENAKSWVNSAMQHAKLTSIDEDGTRHYKYKEFDIICKGEKVITVSYYKDKARDLCREIEQDIRKRVDKELKPLKRQYRETAIKMHEAEIKRLKSYNPKSIESITREINALRDEVAMIENKIFDVENLVNKFKPKEEQR